MLGYIFGYIRIDQPSSAFSELLVASKSGRNVGREKSLGQRLVPMDLLPDIHD